MKTCEKNAGDGIAFDDRRLLVLHGLSLLWRSVWKQKEQQKKQKEQERKSAEISSWLSSLPVCDSLQTP